MNKENPTKRENLGQHDGIFSHLSKWWILRQAKRRGRGYEHFRIWMCALAEGSLPSHHPKGSHMQGESHHQGHTAYMHVWTMPTGSAGKLKQCKSNTLLD
jgi:hypothetical protein